MENEWTPPSDAVEVTGSSFVPPSDAVEVKKKNPTASGLEGSSSERLTTTTTKATVSSSSKGKPNGIYSYPGNENYVYKKDGGQWFVASKSDYKYMPLKTGDVQGRINLLEKKAVSLEQYGFETEPRKEAPLKYTAPVAPKPIAKPKTQAQQREQELFDKEFKALDKTDPEYLRKKAQADAIAARVNQITPDFINDNEEDVVPKVQQIIKDYPYLQVSQSGGGYDELEIVNTITNERKKINLENWTSDRDREEAKRLQGFLDVQMSSKEYVNQYQKVNKIKQEMETATPTQRINLSQKLLEEQAKLNDLSGARYNYAKNDKYRSSAIYDKNAKENVKVDFAKLQLQSIDYAEKANDFKKWNDTVEESRRKGLITEEQYLNDYLPKLDQERQMLLDEQIRIKDDFRKTKSDSVAIDNIAADEYAIQAERGNVLTGATYSALQGAENSLRFLLESGEFKDGEFKGFLTGFAPGSISDEYTSAEGRNAFEQIVFGLANSGGSALVGAAAGVPFLGLYASAYVNTKDQMSGPEFADVPEYQKILFSGALGATVGLLEKYGISKWFSKTPAGKGLTNWVLKKTIAEVGKDASSEAIELAVKKNLGAAVANGLIQVTASGLVEGSTELAQEAADMVYKDIFNKMSEKELFDNPKTWGGVADRLSKSFLLGFAGGAGLQSMTQTLDVASNELNKSQINAIEQMIDSPELKETFRLNLKDQILSGQITKEKAQALAERFNEIEGTLNKIPKNVDRFEAFKLINERDEIQKEIAGKDPALVAAQTERVSEINEQLKQLSKDAVQKQTTSEVPVQPGAAVSGEMAQGEPEAGPQEVTQEGQKYQEVGEQTTTQINVAPLFDTKVKTVEEADAIRQSDMYKQYKDNLSKVATDFNVTIDTIDDTIGGYAGVAEVSTVATVSGDWNDIIKFAAAYGALTPEVQDSTIAGRTVEPQTTEHNADRFDIGINNQEAALKAAEDAGFSEDGFTLSGDKIMFFNIFKFPVKDFDNKYTTFVDKYLEYGGQITSESKSAVQSEFIDSFRRAEILTEAERNAVQQAGREGLRNAVQEAKQRNFPYTVAKAKSDQINLVSKENIDEVISNQDTPTKQKLAKNAKLALRAIPNAKIYLHNTQSEYDAAVGEETDGTEKGAFIASDGAIHINMQEALPNTLLHEAFHYVILNKGIDGKTLTAWANSLKSIVKDRDLVDKIDKLTSKYDPEEQSEEFIAELGSIMADAKDTLSTSALIKFKALINKIAAKIGLPQIFSAEATTQDAVDFINRIGKQLVIGQEITPGDGGEVGTFTIPKRKLQKAASVSNDPRDFIRELVEDVDLREFNGQKFITNMYDYTNAGETDLGNGFKINMLGGKNYVPLMMSLNDKKIGDISNLAAFNTKAQAETFIRNAEKSGATLFAPHSGTLSQSWQFQQHTFAELFNLVLDGDILKSNELIDVFNNTIKNSEANQKNFSVFAEKYGKDIKNFDYFASDPKKIIELLDIKNNYSPKLRKALNNAIASNKKFQQAIGINNKEEFYQKIMDPLNQGMKGGEIMNVVKFDPNTFEIVQTKENAIDHHPSFGWTLLAKIDGIYQPTELHKSVNVTESYTKYNKNGEEVSRKADEPKFENKNVSSSAGAVPKVAEFKAKRKKQIIGQNAYLTKNVKDNLAVAKKMDTANESVKDIRIVTGWEKGVDGKWRYEIEDIKANNRLKDVIANTLKTKTQSTPMYLGDLINNSTPILTAYPSLDKAVIIVDIEIRKNKNIQGSYNLIDVEGEKVDVIFLKANKNIDSVESTLVHELQHAIQEKEGFAKGTNIKSTYEQEIALNRAAKLTEAEQKALDRNISFLSRGIDDVNKMYEYFVQYIKDTLTPGENYNYVVRKLGGEKNLDLENDYVIEYLKENQVPGVRDQKSIIKMFEAKKSFNQVAGNLGYISTAGEVEARNVEARRKLNADAKRKMLLSETEDIPRERQIVDGKIARRKKQIVYNASPKTVEELGKRSGVVYFSTDKREADAYAEMNRGKVREFEIPESDISNEQVVLDKINELNLQPKDKQYSIEESLLYELIDDRFDNSLSQADIKKLFDALKADGVTAFRYKDGAQVVEGTTESIAVIDNRIIAEKSTRKKQLTQNWVPTPVKNMTESPIAKNSDKVRAAAIDLIKGKINQEDYRETVEKYSPIGSIGTLFAPATTEHMELALGKKADKLMAPVVDEKGDKLKKVGTRLDIPSYLNKNAWVVTIHDERIKNGPVVSYRNAVKLKNVEFSTDPRMAINIAAGLMGKSTFARMVGEMEDIPGNTAEEQGLNAQAMVEDIMNDPNWIQVGMNPFRHSFFWNRSNGMPVVSADEVIQIGGLVYAKNAKEVSANSDEFTVYGKYDESKNKVIASEEPLLDKSGKVIKFQKGLSKTQAINAAKDKYDLSVKQRGNTHAQGVESALNDLRKSDWYVESDDIMREEAERELKKFFGQRIKSAPSVGRLMGVKPTKVQIDEAAALKSQLRLEARAAREAKMDLNTKRKALVSAISAMVKDGKISTRQSKSIINKVGKINLDNPVMVDRLINYAEKVFQRADYQERLSEASKIRKSIRRSLKSKELQAEVAGMAKMFTKVDPFLVEDIDQYISNAENVLNAVRPVRGLEVAIRQAADIAAINEFVTEQIELQEKNKKAELMSVYNYLVESGAITDDMTSKEMQEIIDIINTEESEINDPEKKMNFLKNRFEFMAGIIQKMIVNNEDPFTEESLDLNDRQKELMRQLLKIDMDRLSVKQAALVLEAMDNFMNNGITSGVEAVIKNYQGALNADRLAASGKRSRPLKMYFSKGIGKLFGEQFVSLPLLIERMFPGMKNGLKLMSEMGLTDVIKGTAKADYEHKQLVKEYTEQGFYKQKGFMNAENVYERGMLAFLSRNLIGTDTERQNEFTRRVKILEESIKELEAGSATEVKMADLYQKAYDKLKVSDRDIDVIKANAEKMNLEAVEWMTNQWASKYNQLADVSLSVYNSILGSDTNYTPDRYKGLEGADLELDEDLLNRGSAFMSSLDYTNKNKSGVLIETTRPKNLPANRYISLDFDTNNFASLKGAMIDIETAPAIRKVDGFLKSDGYKRMVNGDDRKILTSRVNNYISAVKGKTNFNRDTLKSVERLANFLGSLGVGKALGGLDQAVKQTTPVIVNTIMNAGRFTPLNMDMNAAINRSGMPIANRGIESITAVESIDSLIDKKSTTAAEAVKVIEKVSQMYMKALLSKPDVWVARSSFITYYQKYLRDNGMDTNIDWKEHEWNKDAMEYAQMMVDRQQNISDEKLAGKFLSSRDPMVSVARKVIFPFATFILNQKARMHNDFIALFGSNVSTDDRAKAVKSLGGLAAEMITYQAIAYFIKTMVYDNIASYITGEDDEEEKKERSFFGIKMTKKQWNATKFPVKSFVSDLISPLPLTDDLVTFGFDKLMENFPMITQEEINQSIKDQNDARALKGQDPMDAEMEANFINELKKQNTYSVTFKTDGAGRAYGVPGIAFDTYMELADMAKMATTGEFVEDIGYGPKTKHLSKNDQELVKYVTIPMVLYATGLVPKDFGTVSRKVVNTVKKRSINDNKFKNISALKDELGRKPKEWEESLVMNTQKKLPTIIEAIQFAERFGGLTESQGKEFAKYIELTGDYGYLDLKRIQEGETADQILKK